MADSELSILIKARNEAKAEFDKLNTQVKALQGSTGGLKNKLGGLSQGFEQLAGISLGTAGGLALIGTAAKEVYKFLKESEQAAVEAAKSQAALEAVLRSTGGAVGISVEALDEYATALSRASGLDDELIKSSEAMMLTFTRISGSEFKDAMQAATDMSAVLGTGLKESVIQVGKAMNDFSGYTALKRAGVSFTQSQVDQINKFKESNDLIGYQSLLLSELQKEFGGAAQAINDAGDKSENLKVAFGNLKEAIGAGLVPATRNTNEQLTNFVNNTADAISETVQYNNILKQNGIIWVQNLGYVKDGVQITTTEADAIVDSTIAIQAQTDRLTEQARAYYNAHPELKKYIDENGILREKIEGIANAEDDVADSAKNANSALKGVNETVGLLNNIDTGFGTRIETAIENIKFEKLGGTELQNISDNIIAAIDTGKIGGTMADALLSGVFIGSQAIAIKSGETSAQAAKKIIVETLGMTWAEADAELKKWLNKQREMTIWLNYLIKVDESHYSFDTPLPPPGYIPPSATGGHHSGRTLVGELGPEIIDLPPGSWVHSNRNSQSVSMGGGGGGGVVINLNYAPAMSLSDRTEAETKLVPILRRVLAGIA